MNRFLARMIMAFAVLLGGGSLVLFAFFLLLAPVELVSSGDSESGTLMWDGFLCLLFFVQHSGMIIWSGPDVTSDRLLFNVLWTAWIALGARWEEADMVAAFGEPYRRYQRTVPMLVPWRSPSGRRLAP